MSAKVSLKSNPQIDFKLLSFSCSFDFESQRTRFWLIHRIMIAGDLGLQYHNFWRAPYQPFPCESDVNDGYSGRMIIEQNVDNRTVSRGCCWLTTLSMYRRGGPFSSNLHNRVIHTSIYGMNTA